uniref:Cell division cycle 34, ubiqiutin conjugating enzyme n=1 Tax=Ficedula albicollis TaxID=59894 RepID=A0A803V0P2_FICAL
VGEGGCPGWVWGSLQSCSRACGLVDGQGELDLSVDAWGTPGLQSAPGGELERRWLLQTTEGPLRCEEHSAPLGALPQPPPCPPGVRVQDSGLQVAGVPSPGGDPRHCHPTGGREETKVPRVQTETAQGGSRELGWGARLRFPIDYPYSPPAFRFLTKMWHPNIYETGDVCISILHPPVDDPQSGELPSERWNPTQNVRTILLSVISLLNEPNTFSPANVDASVMYRKWKESKGKDREYTDIIRKQVLGTKVDAERDGVKVPTTLAEYCVKTKTPAPDEGSDLFYDDYYEDDEMEEEEESCYGDEDDSGNEES